MEPSKSQSKGVALVTGAARGIGRAIALRLADDGFDVAVNDLPNTPELVKLVKEIEAKGRRAIAALGDVSIESAVADMIQQTVGELGSLDVMVANAGIVIIEEFLSTSVEAFDKQMAVNARSVMLCYQHAARQMISQGRGGRIIGASSMAGKQATELLFAYSATKFAIRGMTQSAAAALGKYKITVNAYAPGGIETRLPVGRTGQPDEVAQLVSYFASKEAGFVTGQSCATPDEALLHILLT
ncbi:hypothetical protein BGW80DRAFT_1436596 [Lactifluus volemus]|nr:hypothetical protein BGW80DRAFT_1436596 [Lactifluus volemus]